MMLRAEAKPIPFRGNGPYCYSNAASVEATQVVRFARRTLLD